MNTSTVVALARKSTHTFSKQPQPSLLLLAGEGVEGDAHRGPTTQHLFRKRKTPEAPNLAQVHLFAQEKLDELRTLGFALSPGDLGENILTRGLDLHALPLGTRLRIGPSAVLEVTGERTPCSQIDNFRPGLQQHLWGPRSADGKRLRRAGIMTTVQTTGLIHPHDPIHLELPPEPHHPLPPV